jgi:hypothetical protein
LIILEVENIENHENLKKNKTENENFKNERENDKNDNENDNENNFFPAVQVVHEG